MIVPVSKAIGEEGPTVWRCTTCGPGVEPDHRCGPMSRERVRARNARTRSVVESMLAWFGDGR